MRSVHENQPLDEAYKLSNVLLRLALQAAKKPVWILLFRKIVISRLYLRMGGRKKTSKYLKVRHFTLESCRLSRVEWISPRLGLNKHHGPQLRPATILN